MGEYTTERLLQNLSQGLVPVRRIPRIRVALVGVAIAFAAAVALDARLAHPMPDFGRAVWGGFASVSVLFGLAAAAAGGIVAALSRALPGREPDGQVALGVALVGLLLAVAGGTGASLLAGRSDLHLAVQPSAMCIVRSTALGLLPALVMCLFLGWAGGRRPLVGAALALLGALGLGAGFVHASCGLGDALHMLVGHAAAPLIATSLLVAPLVLLVRWSATRLAPPR